MEKTYIRKPIQVKALQWNGDNFDEIKKFCKEALLDYDGKLLLPMLNDSNHFMYAKHIAKESDYVVLEDGKFVFRDASEFEKEYNEEASIV